MLFLFCSFHFNTDQIPNYQTNVDLHLQIDFLHFLNQQYRQTILPSQINLKLFSSFPCLILVRFEMSDSPADNSKRESNDHSQRPSKKKSSKHSSRRNSRSETRNRYDPYNYSYSTPGTGSGRNSRRASTTGSRRPSIHGTFPSFHPIPDLSIYASHASSTPKIVWLTLVF